MIIRDVCTPIRNEKADKTYWTKIGTAFLKDDGSINILFDALPLNGKVSLFDRKPKEQQQQQQPAGFAQYSPPQHTDEDLPF